MEVDVSKLIQAWTADLVANDGLLLRLVGESEGIDFVRFMSSSGADPLVEPRVWIEYSLPPSAWFEH